jgi:predicted Zn-dependent protease
MQTNDRPAEAARTEAQPDTWVDGAEDREWGEWLYGELAAHFDVETEPWAVELMERVSRRLHRERAPAAPLEPVILWMTTPTAFTAPGRYVYYSRGLLHLASWEEAVAFTLAHEMAHHDLGHTRLYRGNLALVRHLPASLIAAAIAGMADHWLNGPELEAAADARALDLCLAAGYDGLRCIQMFDRFEAYALDYHTIEAVFGPEPDPGPRPEGVAGVSSAIRSWLWHRRNGYAPIRTRKEALLDLLEGERVARAA